MGRAKELVELMKREVDAEHVISTTSTSRRRQHQHQHQQHDMKTFM
jgi:hypothetical protein